MTDIYPILAQVKEASRKMHDLTDSRINDILTQVAGEIEKQTEMLLAANAEDLRRMPEDDPKYDRLKLTAERLRGIAADMWHVATLPSPLGRTLQRSVRPNGMEISRVTVPFGVIGVIYEARPNVSFDVFALCLKSGNACVLKGGSDARSSNEAIVCLIHSVLRRMGICTHIVELLPPDRESTAQLLCANSYIDLLIPRGSSSLISYVRQHATVPVIETGAGVCHTYFHTDGNPDMGAAIINNAKTRRVSVCNALDCLLIDRSRLADLPALCLPLAESHVTIYADEEALHALEGIYPSGLLLPATEKSFGTEFLDYRMAVRTVSGMDEALTHIARYGSGHSECIVTDDEEAADRFIREVDAACVYANVSTAFTDGAQFGLGAEIGISTQKMHARGPMALEAMTTYKWIVRGNGQTRPG